MCCVRGRVPGLIAAAAILAGCADGSGARPSKLEFLQHGLPQRIVVLGDSLAVSPGPGQGFPAMLNERLMADGFHWRVTNGSVIGDTTADGLQRLDPLLEADVRILILALGANDGLQGLPIATIEHNLATIIERVQARGIAVLLCGMETLPLHGFQYALDFHDLFPALAARYNLPLVPFLLSGVALDPAMNLPDGVHPNRAGARRIADNVWPFLLPLLTTAGSVATTRP